MEKRSSELQLVPVNLDIRVFLEHDGDGENLLPMVQREHMAALVHFRWPSAKDENAQGNTLEMGKRDAQALAVSAAVLLEVVAGHGDGADEAALTESRGLDEAVEGVAVPEGEAVGAVDDAGGFGVHLAADAREGKQVFHGEVCFFFGCDAGGGRGGGEDRKASHFAFLRHCLDVHVSAADGVLPDLVAYLGREAEERGFFCIAFGSGKWLGVFCFVL